MLNNPAPPKKTTGHREFKGHILLLILLKRFSPRAFYGNQLLEVIAEDSHLPNPAPTERARGKVGLVQN